MRDETGTHIVWFVIVVRNRDRDRFFRCTITKTITITNESGPVQSIMPVTLTNAFADLPDTAVNLVHMGNGRWYDPAIGRPLQPNPTGGTPPPRKR